MLHMTQTNHFLLTISGPNMVGKMMISKNIICKINIYHVAMISGSSASCFVSLSEGLLCTPRRSKYKPSEEKMAALMD